MIVNFNYIVVIMLWFGFNSGIGEEVVDWVIGFDSNFWLYLMILFWLVEFNVFDFLLLSGVFFLILNVFVSFGDVYVFFCLIGVKVECFFDVLVVERIKEWFLFLFF